MGNNLRERRKERAEDDTGCCDRRRILACGFQDSSDEFERSVRLSNSLQHERMGQDMVGLIEHKKRNRDRTDEKRRDEHIIPTSAKTTVVR